MASFTFNVVDSMCDAVYFYDVVQLRLTVIGCFSSMDNIDGGISMQSAGSGDAMSPQHFIVEKGLSDARGERDARVQVLLLPNELCLPTDQEYLSLLSDLTHISSSFPLSPLSPSITPVFHSRLRTRLFFTDPFLHSSSTTRTPAVFHLFGHVGFNFGTVC